MDKLKTENDHLIQRQAQLHDESLYHEQQYLQIETRLKEIESENKRLKSGMISHRNCPFEINTRSVSVRWSISLTLDCCNQLDCINQDSNWATK